MRPEQLRDGRDGRDAADEEERAPQAGRVGDAPLSSRAKEIAEYLDQHGASFFTALHEGTGGGFPKETVDALWELVWRGVATNDTLHPLRAFARGEDTRSVRRTRGVTFRSRPAYNLATASSRLFLFSGSGACASAFSACSSACL